MLSASRVALRPLLRPTQLGHYNHCKHGISSQAVTSQIRFLSTPPASKPKRVYVPQATTADGLKTTWFMGLMQQVSASRLFSEKLKMSLYPPFFLMGVSILTLRNSWREVKIKLPLNTLSRNPGGERQTHTPLAQTLQSDVNRAARKRVVCCSFFLFWLAAGSGPELEAMWPSCSQTCCLLLLVLLFCLATGLGRAAAIEERGCE